MFLLSAFLLLFWACNAGAAISPESPEASIDLSAADEKVTRKLLAVETVCCLIAVFEIQEESAQDYEVEGTHHEVEVTAKVVKYVERAYQQDFDGGYGASFDAVVLIILKPLTYSNQKIIVCQATSAASDSFLRKEGSELSFFINISRLSGQGDVFDGALREIHLVSE
jgi:hypothetical protein